ncbi:MAG: serine/threonine protein kinase, partial [Acidobacteria bacterium]|nr:serine/threonine protein kinase [Acidobacteriota bacterium]
LQTGCAHELHIVHRDISPDNIILTADGTLKLSNFGIAKPENSPQLTQAGAILGDFKYISPEQVRGGRELDARSDIYSLGALFYHMICGKPPFEARSRFEVMVAHVNQAPAPPSSVTRSIPGNLDAVILKALAKNPAERYQTAGEFAAAVRELPASEPVAVPAGAASKPARLQWVLMGGAGLAAVCIALWLAAK